MAVTSINSTQAWPAMGAAAGERRHAAARPQGYGADDRASRGGKHER